MSAGRAVERGGQRLVLEPAPRRRLRRRQRIARHVHQRPEYRGVDPLLGEELGVEVERVQRGQERPRRRLVADLEPHALAREQPDAAARAAAPERLEDLGRDVVDVDVDDHAAVSPGALSAGRRRG